MCIRDRAYIEQQKKYNEEKLSFIYEEIEKHAAINVNIIKALQNNKTCVENLLTYIHDGVQNDNMRILADVKKYNLQTSLDLQVDETQLYNVFIVLSKFIKIIDKRVGIEQNKINQQVNAQQGNIPPIIDNLNSNQTIQIGQLLQKQSIAQSLPLYNTYVTYPVAQQTQQRQSITPSQYQVLTQSPTYAQYGYQSSVIPNQNIRQIL
eukprot:TRINITY_DN317_c0_g1_i6.p1 TRINITY_DN317_c0_g1~~TRINITY_DN317_c0_g1_i6.p1  ORF type:complete len:207 (-),score=31.55 TRINITY_DN317_c0_g1_i6:314-934(-)